MSPRVVLACVLILALELEQSLCAKSTHAYLLQDHKSYSLALSLTNQNGFKPGSNASQTFLVQAPKYHRVMIVLQQLHLWSEIDEDIQSYLQFVDSDGTTSEKIFGNIDPEENGASPRYLTGPRSFTSTDDTASLVLINLRPDYLVSSKNERRVYAKVVFTAFRDTCSYRSIPLPTNNDPTDQIANSSVKETMLYRSCITSSASGTNCIAADLFCDGILNCGESQPEIFGVDETYTNCNDKVTASRTYATINHTQEDTTKIPNKRSGVSQKTLIVDEEYDEYFTELFKSIIIGFLGLCTACILIAFIVTMFCLKQN